MDNTHPKFLPYCSSNPALYTKCNILWSEGWNKEAMLHVAKNELTEVLSSLGKTKDDILNASLMLHNSCLQLGASPLKFLNFIQNFKNIYTKTIQTSGG